jgi:hypothetical protein
MSAEQWEPEDFKAWQRGEYVPKKAEKSFLEKWENVINQTTKPTRKARGRGKHIPGSMNKLEQRYADELKLAERTLAIEWWAFEPIKLKLADKTYYTPDFCVMHLDGTIEFVETKGKKCAGYYCEDDAKVKIKVAAKMFPMFAFVIKWPLKEGGWGSEHFH